ncbi:MAG: HlyD family efflux transporter periplasmic adaptor subunit, partial [Planctomycetota bacterium]
PGSTAGVLRMKWLPLVCVALATCPFTVMACPDASGQTLSSETARKPATIRLQNADVTFQTTVAIPAQSSGLIEDIVAQPNQMVRPGQTLSQMDTRTLTLQRKAALLRYQAAGTALEDDLELRFAETAWEEAKAELEASRSTSDRVAGAVPANQLRRMRLAVERGELEVSRAKKLRREADIELQIKAAELAAIDQKIAELQCVSPINGLVLSIHKSPGEWAAVGETVVTVGSIGRLRVTALADLADVAPETLQRSAVSVHWVDKSQSFVLHGRISSIDPVRLPGNRIRIQAEVQNRLRNPPLDQAEALDWLLWPGTEVELQLHPSVSSVAALPQVSGEMWR